MSTGNHEVVGTDVAAAEFVWHALCNVTANPTSTRRNQTHDRMLEKDALGHVASCQYDVLKNVMLILLSSSLFLFDIVFDKSLPSVLIIGFCHVLYPGKIYYTYSAMNLVTILIRPWVYPVHLL